MLGHAGQPLERDPDYLDALVGGAGDARRRRAQRRAQAVGDRVERRPDVDGRQRPRRACSPAIAAFGADRCMFASNWPIDRLYGTYHGLVAAYREIVGDLAEADRRALWHGTADRVYRIEEGAPS